MSADCGTCRHIKVTLHGSYRDASVKCDSNKDGLRWYISAPDSRIARKRPWIFMPNDECIQVVLDILSDTGHVCRKWELWDSQARDTHQTQKLTTELTRELSSP